MAKDILKQKIGIQTPETKEVPRGSEPVVEIQTSQESVVEQPREPERSSSSESSPVGETSHKDQLVTSRRAASVGIKQTDKLEEEIEDILEEDLKELYLTMSPDKQAEFCEKGEQTRSRIRQIVRSAKINAKKIFHLIRDWLKIIPGVNRFFLEQEAKIKTDKILFVSEEEKKRSEDL
ncbi:hypothetical protein HY626_04595 [Candidatus Uhrbacteria bacterium]|nr:hypothetical protein [Candidatus Uhrbacteria bacterium]